MVLVFIINFKDRRVHFGKVIVGGMTSSLTVAVKVFSNTLIFILQKYE